ncbi:MAG: hypothetical protein AAFO94_18195, partial [Bacteroidota bacterium]
MKKLLLLFLAIGICLQYSCDLKKAKKDDTNMKTFHDDDYAAAWATIDSLRKKGLPQSALEKANELYRQAKQDNSSNQIIKTVMVRGNLIEEVDEDGQVKAINNLRREIESTAMPVQAILQSMLGERYASYLRRYQWQLRNRTEINDYQPEDIKTWSIANFIDASAVYYLASLDHDGMDTINIEQFAPITTEPRNVEGLRPSLYDFLAHRALGHFMNDRSYLTEPVYAFQLNMEDAFAKAEKFAALKMKVKDTESRKYQAFRIFQKLISAHLNDEDPKAL